MFLTNVQSVRSPHNKNKCQQGERQLLPVLQVTEKSSKDSLPKQVTALLDTGASSTIINQLFIDKTPKKQSLKRFGQPPMIIFDRC